MNLPNTIGKSPVFLLAGAVALALVAIPFAAQLDVSTDLDALLPQQLPAVQSFRAFEEQLGGHTFLSIVIEGPDPEANTSFGDHLAARLAQRAWAHHVHFRRDRDFVEQRWPFLIEESELLRLESDLSDAIKRAKLNHSPLSIGFDDEQPGPDWDRIRSLTSIPTVKANPDGTVVLMQVQLSQLTSRIEETRRIVAEAEQDIAATEPHRFHPDLRARPYGGLRFRIAEYDAVLRDLGRASMVTLPLILLIPALVLRSFWQPLVVLIPVGVGMACTYGTAQHLYGSLNLVTCFLFLILFGIGDDYPIHLLYRIREEISRGTDFRQAISRAVRVTAVPLAFTAFTALAAFLSLAWMQFRGFSQFGVIAAIGVCFILIATLVTVPGIVWLIRSHLKTRRELRSREATPTTRPRKNLQKLLVVVAVWCLVVGTGMCVVQDELEYEQDFASLRPTLPELAELRDRAEVIEGFRKSSPAVFWTPDFEISRRITQEIRRRMDRDGDNSPIAGVISLAAILDADTTVRRQSLARILRLLDDQVILHAPQDLACDLKRMYQRLDLSPLALDGIPASVRQSLMRPGAGGQDLYLVVVEPKNRISYLPHAQAFAQSVGGVRASDKEYVPAGEALIFAEIIRLVREEGWVALLIAWFATGIIIYLAFRNWLDLVALMLTLAGAMAITLAALALLDIRLSFFNLTVLPLMVGLGINYGIHVLHRYREDGVSAALAARRLAPSVGSAAATTVVGFAGLLFAGHPGLWSMGITAVLGIGFVSGSCLVFLPSIRDLLGLLALRTGLKEEPLTAGWKQRLS